MAKVSYCCICGGCLEHCQVDYKDYYRCTNCQQWWTEFFGSLVMVMPCPEKAPQASTNTNPPIDWERRDERTAQALADALGVPIVAGTGEDALVGYVEALTRERDNAMESRYIAWEQRDAAYAERDRLSMELTNMQSGSVRWHDLFLEAEQRVAQMNLEKRQAEAERDAAYCAMCRSASGSPNHCYGGMTGCDMSGVHGDSPDMTQKERIRRAIEQRPPCPVQADRDMLRRWNDSARGWANSYKEQRDEYIRKDIYNENENYRLGAELKAIITDRAELETALAKCKERRDHWCNESLRDAARAAELEQAIERYLNPPINGERYSLAQLRAVLHDKEKSGVNESERIDNYIERLEADVHRLKGRVRGLEQSNDKLQLARSELTTRLWALDRVLRKAITQGQCPVCRGQGGLHIDCEAISALFTRRTVVDDVLRLSLKVLALAKSDYSIDEYDVAVTEWEAAVVAYQKEVVSV